jgi:hypothetical protein
MSKPLAQGFIRNLMAQAGRNGSAFDVYKHDIKFLKQRNQRECMSLARVLDALLAKRVDVALERLCRRLAGVHAADQANDHWALCDAFELVMERQSFVPDDHLQRVVKAVMRMQALESAGAKKTGGARSHGGKPAGSAFGSSKPPSSKSAVRGSSSYSTGAPSSASRKKTQPGKGGSDE